jgi:tetratricopeptide (TPR) repeat protein
METANTPQDYLNFLMEVLQKVSEDPTPQLIYPFFKQNLGKLDENLIQALDDWAENTLLSVDAKEAEYIAGVIFDFSSLIEQYSLGNIAYNLEIAIVGYRIALSVFTFDTFPQDWASTQNNLAVAYSNRIRGDKADNLEQAIICYQEALKVRTFDAFPQDWAITNNNLGGGYCKRIRGDKADNIEQAIVAYTKALKVRTFNTFPKDWASTQDNLGNAYFFRIRGDKAENLEKAIIAYMEALKVRTFDRRFKLEMQRVLMKQRILRMGYDSQEIFSVCDL